MALTYTPPGSLGQSLSHFSLPSVGGGIVNTASLGADAILIAFICNHCPYVRAIESRVIDLAREFAPAGLSTLAICANDPAEYPEDAPAALLQRATDLAYPFPYLIDEPQGVARELGAVCTPDFFLYDRARRLTYRGRLDDSWRDAARVTRRELAEAVRLTLDGRPVPAAQNPAMGCSIKWRD